MTFKEFVISRVQLFFFLVALILAASAVLGAVYAPEQEIKYYHLFSPIIISGMCVLPTCVTYFKKEPTLGQYIVRNLIELVLIEAVVMLLVTAPAGIEKSAFYIILGAVVLLIYTLANVMVWLQKYQQSKKLTEQLKKLQLSD